MREALDRLRADASVSYAEVRFCDERTEDLRVRDGALENLSYTDRRGVGVRVLARGQWGFACTSASRAEDIVRTALRARDIALASARAGGDPVVLAPREPSVGTYATALSVDPFEVPLDQKLADLIGPSRVLLARGAPVRHAEAHMGWTRQRKHLLTTDGVDVSQDITFGGLGMQCVAVGADGRAQRRSFPTAQDGDAWQGGYERVAALDFTGAAEVVREEACALLDAPQMPAGARTVILEGSQLALQIHESCGHPTELDRALGTEISLAGGSFLDPARRGGFRYGSDRVNLTADATSPGGMGTFGWDDEGTPASRTPLVERGLFVNYLSSRETAATLHTAASGAMRADGYARAPLIRMVNVNLEPDPHGPSLEDLIADTADGVLIATNKSWSIDDLRLNFQFGCEIAWEIKHGKRTRILRDPVYTGVTPRFWGGCDAICGPRDWKLWAILNCGKGEPSQNMQVGHGTAPARFQNVEVGHG